MDTSTPALSAFSGLNTTSPLDNFTSYTTELHLDYSSESVTEYNYDYPEDDFGRCIYERHGATILPALYAVLFFFGLVGNSLVIWVIACGVQLRSMTDVCLMNLAIADLLLVCSLPFLAHQARDQWVFGDFMCKAVLGTYYVSFYCGIFFISLMSIDRYLAVVHAVYAMRVRTRSFGIMAAAVTWLVGLISSFPDPLYLKLQPGPGPNNTLVCYPEYPSDENIHTSTHFWLLFRLFKMNTLGLFVPIFIMCFCYSQIVWRLLYSRSSKKQAIRLVLVVVAVFFCCWVPYNLASFFRALELLGVYTECESSKDIRLALHVTEAVAYLHSCLNPILYVFVGEKFRRQLLRLINRTPCRLCQAIKVFLPQDRINGSAYSQTTSVDERSTAV